MAFLTMESKRQLVASGGNGFRLFQPFREWAALPWIATGCNDGAP
jgi:peptidase E